MSLSERLSPRFDSAVRFKPGSAGPPPLLFLMEVLLSAFSPQLLSRDEPGNTWSVNPNHFLLNIDKHNTWSANRSLSPTCLGRLSRRSSCSFSVFGSWRGNSNLLLLLLSWMKRRRSLWRVWIQQAKEMWFQHLWCGDGSRCRRAPGHLRDQRKHRRTRQERGR